MFEFVGTKVGESVFIRRGYHHRLETGGPLGIIESEFFAYVNIGIALGP
jgi:hypothetical protein